MSSPSASRTAKKAKSFRVGRVRVYLRGRVWYLCYHEQGKRHQPRIGPERDVARQMAAEINSQLEVGAPSAYGFQPISIPNLRQAWLEHHEHVWRSSLHTIRRYRAATEHLLRFVDDVRPVRRASDFRASHAQELVRYLRHLEVAPNGHRNSAKRRLRDKGIKYILETCSTLFGYAAKQRHLPPYAENPFQTIEIHRIPVEDSKPVDVFSPDEERRFLEACDDWQFPIFATLLLTGLRPGELTHLLLPDNLDLDRGWLFVRNKPGLGWRVKTRNERDIPLIPQLVDLLRVVIGERRTGPIFQQRRCSDGYTPPLVDLSPIALERDVVRRADQHPNDDRNASESAARTVWRDIGALKEDWIRREFMRVAKRMGRPEITAPKMLRHTFATCLQDANVDPLIRNELMGHSPSSTKGANGLGMTAIYTHTRPETKRKQLEDALIYRPAVAMLMDRLKGQSA
ncbi:site-specific tyrosine recombinase XerC [Planctomycetes bacterium Pan216]|uniref:Site-specific tyrosine recombinase XerC n=1 Tax=Kolteria novifilia TaxID=2527975 RepID=A0A518AYY7_9BACT|nr:site-specific tyrosine recombinase XerC [Planctomycetes bacterium Pan216]